MPDGGCAEAVSSCARSSCLPQLVFLDKTINLRTVSICTVQNLLTAIFILLQFLQRAGSSFDAGIF